MNEKPTCPQCGEVCVVIPLDNSFDYAGSHCTHGNPGRHYPRDYGTPVSDCCEAEIEDYFFRFNIDRKAFLNGDA